MSQILQVELELTGFSSFYRVYLYSRGWYYLKLLGNGFQRVHLLVSNIAKYLQPNLREQHGLLGNVEGPTHKCESASSGDNNQNISISKPKYLKSPQNARCDLSATSETSYWAILCKHSPRWHPGLWIQPNLQPRPGKICILILYSWALCQRWETADLQDDQCKRCKHTWKCFQKSYLDSPQKI